MKTLIIYAHPYEKSFNHHIYQEIVKNIPGKLDVIDLYKDNFNLIYSQEELALYKEGQTTSPQIKDYQERLSNASKLIFIFPIWWNDLPGIVKNFIDLVMKKNFAYSDTPRGVAGKLTMIESVTVISTSNSPTWYLKFFAGNSIKKVFLKTTCKQLGIKKSNWFNLGAIKTAPDSTKTNFINKLKQSVV